MKRLALAAVAATALALVAGAAVLAADPTPVPDTLGFRIAPRPVSLDDGERAITIANRSGEGIALSVTITPSDGYAVDTRTVRLPAGPSSATITLVEVDPSRDGTLDVVVAADAPEGGTVRSAVAASVPLRHQTWIERHRDLLMLGLALAAGLGLLAASLIRRRVTRRRPHAHPLKGGPR